MKLIEHTFGSLVEKWANETPDKDFLVYSDRNLRLSYKEFNQRVDNVAKGLLEIGVLPDTKIGIWAKNVPDWLTFMFAAAKLGAVLVTINTSYKKTEVEYILKKADIHTLCLVNGYHDSNYLQIIYDLVPELVTSRRGELTSKDFPMLKNVVFIGQEKQCGMFSTAELILLGSFVDDTKLNKVKGSVTCHMPVNMQFTSGTTGFPKGVMLSHHNILNNGLATGQRMKFTNEDKVLTCVPLFHCFGCVLALCAVITHGATMVMVEEFDPLKVLASIHKEKCTIVYGVPTMFIAELNHPMFNIFNMSSLRTGIMAGSVCPVDTMEQAMTNMHCNLISVYGLTESSPGMTATDICDSFETRVYTVGKEFPGIEVKILDPETGKECPVGTPGEFCCRGWNVMLGYYNDPVATSEVIDKNGFLHSGDIGIKDDDGYFRVTGRLKDMIIRGGENIYPKEIENFIYTIPEVESVEVVGVPSKKYGEQVVAFIVCKKEKQLTAEQVRLFCRGKIAHYKIPKYIFIIEVMPMTASGKIQKYKLRELAIKMLKENNITVV